MFNNNIYDLWAIGIYSCLNRQNKRGFGGNILPFLGDIFPLYDNWLDWLLILMTFQCLPSPAWPRCLRWRRLQGAVQVAAGGWPRPRLATTDDCPTSPTSTTTTSPVSPSPAGVSTPVSVCCSLTQALRLLPSPPLSRHLPPQSLPGRQTLSYRYHQL